MELLAVFPPFFTFILVFLFGEKIGDKGAQFFTCAGVFIAALASIVLFFDVNIHGHSYTTVLTPWLHVEGFTADWALRVDQLSVVMMCVINVVSACVHFYSIGYMSKDPAKARFMAYLSLFTFAMLMLVTADNLLQLFFGWEGVGLASYLLIGFWNEKPSANAAAIKAFVVNRVGDFGLILGLMAVFILFGTIEFDPVFTSAALYHKAQFNIFGLEFHALTLIGLLLFAGAVGKSAQLGLHTWLPDAMEGPTPVSALIHAATMVTAGVFLVARFSPLYEYAPGALMIITVFGALTAFIAATIALTQFDIKRVIAYSTMSQLGYMFFALGVSAYSAAMFHLMTHAFFKALLFLGAGSVIHALSGEQDMRNMGGIYKKIPVTYVLMWIGGLALAGIPPFAGYFSKDIILEAVWADQSWFGNFAYWAGIAAAFMTAFYTWRMILMTFHGPARASNEAMNRVHESPPVMLSPLMILGAGAVLAGFIFYGGFVGSGHDETIVVQEITDQENEAEIHAWSKEYFWGDSLQVRPGNDTVEAAHTVPYWIKKLPLLAGLLGIALAYLMYMFKTALPGLAARIFRPLYRLFSNKWYFDDLYEWLFVRPSFCMGHIFWQRGDQGLIDRYGPDGSALTSQKLAALYSRFQNGYIYHYAFIMILALIGLLSWILFRWQGGVGI